MKPTPLNTVKTKFESKAKLVDKLLPHLKKKEGEDKDAFKKRLLSASCTRLLRLHARTEKSASEKK